jgi:probable O-glycosylation ligase (exosortase A-associated)
MIFGPEDSFIEGNNALGLALVMVIPLMRFLQLDTTKRYLKLGLTGAIGLTSLAVLASYSRGAFLAISAILVFMIMKTRQKMLFLLAVAITVPIMWGLMPEEWHERLGTIRTYEQDASAMGRINAWWFAWNVAKERPLVGGGFDAFSPDTFKDYAPNPLDFHDAHSIYFEMLGEHGFVGLGLFLLLGWLALRECGRIMREARDREDLRWAHDLGAMMQVSLIGYAVGGAFLGLAYWDLFYHLVALTVVTAEIVRRQSAERTADLTDRAAPEETQPPLAATRGGG